MVFSVLERLLLLDILPKEGDILSLKTARKLREAISFTDEEHEIVQFRKTGEVYVEDGVEKVVYPGQVAWMNKEYKAEIEVSEKAEDMIVVALKKASETRKLTDQYIDLYDRFVK